MKQYSIKKIKFIYELSKKFKDDEMFGPIYNELFPRWMVENISLTKATKTIRYILHEEGNENEMIRIKEEFKPLRFILLLKRENIDIDEYNKL